MEKIFRNENEATWTLKRYFCNESNTVHFFGSDSGVNLFANVLQNGETFVGDAPDAVIIKDEIAIIIEHFEFDSFHATRRGSSSRIEQARIDREQRKIKATADGVVYHSKIQAECSYQDYVNNVRKNFLEHYRRIDVYKKNLIDKNIITDNMIVKTMFLIDDVSPVGTMAYDKNGVSQPIVPVVLALCPEFLDLLTDSPNLDYVLCCSSAGSNEYIWFIDLGNIQTYIENQCDYVRMQFLSNKPSVLVSKISIPNEDVERCAGSAN